MFVDIDANSIFAVVLSSGLLSYFFYCSFAQKMVWDEPALAVKPQIAWFETEIRPNWQPWSTDLSGTLAEQLTISPRNGTGYRLLQVTCSIFTPIWWLGMVHDQIHICFEKVFEQKLGSFTGLSGGLGIEWAGEDTVSARYFFRNLVTWHMRT